MENFEKLKIINSHLMLILQQEYLPMKSYKSDLLQFLTAQIHSQLHELNEEIDSIIIEIGNETKSSAGDKFETSREMMNQERGRIETRIGHLKNQLRALSEIEKRDLATTIDFGSLVKTSRGTFLFGLAIGKVIFKEEDVMVISLNSPIGKAFLAKKEKEEVNFQNTNYQILNIR